MRNNNRRDQPHDDECFICQKTFSAALLDGTSGGWTFQWNSPTGVKIVAETCGAACSATFDDRYRDDLHIARIPA